MLFCLYLCYLFDQVEGTNETHNKLNHLENQAGAPTLWYCRYGKLGGFKRVAENYWP